MGTNQSGRLEFCSDSEGGVDNGSDNGSGSCVIATKGADDVSFLFSDIGERKLLNIVLAGVVSSSVTADWRESGWFDADFDIVEIKREPGIRFKF